MVLSPSRSFCVKHRARYDPDRKAPLTHVQSLKINFATESPEHQSVSVKHDPPQSFDFGCLAGLGLVMK